MSWTSLRHFVCLLVHGLSKEAGTKGFCWDGKTPRAFGKNKSSEVLVWPPNSLGFQEQTFNQFSRTCENLKGMLIWDFGWFARQTGEQKEVLTSWYLKKLDVK